MVRLQVSKNVGASTHRVRDRPLPATPSSGNWCSPADTVVLGLRDPEQGAQQHTWVSDLQKTRVSTPGLFSASMSGIVMQPYLHLSVPGLAPGTTCSQCSVSTGGKSGNTSKPGGKPCDFTVLSAAALRDHRAWTLSAAACEDLWAMPCNQKVLEDAVGCSPSP